MNFDFHDKYKDYSNIDLLKIVRRPTEYQVAAVDAATQILSTREVTQSDFEMVEIFFNETNTETKRKTEKINSYKEKTADFFESVLNPTTEIKPEKWLNILLLVIGLQYLWTLYVNIVDLVKLIKYVIDCKQQYPTQTFSLEQEIKNDWHINKCQYLEKYKGIELI